MSQPTKSQAGSLDERLTELLEMCLESVEKNGFADAASLTMKAPELADDLRACLASFEFIRRVGGKIENAGRDHKRQVPVRAELESYGDFQIIREVGRGGMGIVYEALQISLGRRVALKVLPSSATLDSRQKARFRLESRAAALLNHPNIVPVFAVGHDRGVDFYAMQFVEGPTLNDMVQFLTREKPSNFSFKQRWGERPTATLRSNPLATLIDVRSRSAADPSEGAARRLRTRGWKTRPITSPFWRITVGATKLACVRPITIERSPSSQCKRRTPWRMLIPRELCIATSNLRICCWTIGTNSGLPILAWRGSSTTKRE